MNKYFFFILFVILLCCIIILGIYVLAPTRMKVINTTSITIESDSLYLGKLDYYSIQHASFKIKNTGKDPLVIQSVNTSCGCTAAKYDKKPITQGETTIVVLEYKPNSLGYFRKTADVVCNVPKGYIRLKISGEVVEK